METRFGLAQNTTNQNKRTSKYHNLEKMKRLKKGQYFKISFPFLQAVTKVYLRLYNQE